MRDTDKKEEVKKSVANKLLQRGFEVHNFEQRLCVLA